MGPCRGTLPCQDSARTEFPHRILHCLDHNYGAKSWFNELVNRSIIRRTGEDLRGPRSKLEGWGCLIRSQWHTSFFFLNFGINLIPIARLFRSILISTVSNQAEARGWAWVHGRVSLDPRQGSRRAIFSHDAVRRSQVMLFVISPVL